ncbi:class I SAM-dependent methyltransferase [Novosphingobium sp. 9]|uniref:class I SAM-dependent methyltransferase n=1 Tax=Novosphingobium sp. 9 TaxID=2025349 RepID=UPI0021B54D5D|nr:class I SAM-dependent methyltransferase [Novosphingobium sp. 9]
MTDRNDALIHSQFGTVAAAYVGSAVHASGADLQHIAKLAEIHRPAHALDLGAGGGHVSYAMAPFAGTVTACDLSPQMLDQVIAEATRRGFDNVDVTTAPAEALPFADGTFDFLACRFSTHHWHDAMAGLREARRVLKPRASAVFADVMAPSLAITDTHLQAIELLRDLSHVRDYSTAEWTSMLTQAGFAICSFTTARLRMDFADWTSRMRTSHDRCEAIRTLQRAAAPAATAHFEIEDDGSFTLDTILIEVC